MKFNISPPSTVGCVSCYITRGINAAQNVISLYNRAMRRKLKRAFTLIELSIVLVFIGLGIGGMMMGNNMIRAAEIRAQIVQFQEYDMALKTFKFKYNGIPGDILNASQFGLTNGWNADGNGLINNKDNYSSGSYCGHPAPDLYMEEFSLFTQLSEAKLIKGKFQSNITFGDPETARNMGFPVAKIGGKGIYIYTKADGNLAYFWGFNILTAPAVDPPYIHTRSTAGVVSPIDAFAIDQKRDDGSPISGHIRSARLTTLGGNCWWFRYPGYNTTDDTCSTASTNSYNLSNPNPDCRLIIDAQ